MANAAAVMNFALGLGRDPAQLTFTQVSLRGIIVFVALLVMVRLANRRFIAQLSAVDVILGFILASMLARAVNGSSAFLPTIGAGFVMVAVHRVLAHLAYRYPSFGAVVKGRPSVLVEDGRIARDAMRRANISEEDLLEEARLNSQAGSVDQIRRATLERNGHVSVLKRD